MKKSQDETYSEEEAQRRFEGLVKAALNTPPKPMKDRPKKRSESKAPKASKARKASKPSS